MIKWKRAMGLMVLAAILLAFSAGTYGLNGSKAALDMREAKILQVKGRPEMKPPVLSRKNIETSRIIKDKYSPILKDSYFLSNGRSERMLAKMSVRLDAAPAAVIGYNEKEDYIEYLPFNYDAGEQTAEFVAENNMAIIPVAYDEEYAGEDSREAMTARAMAAYDRNFNITGNYGGSVSVNIQTLYNTSDTLYYKIYRESTLVRDKTYISGPSLSSSFSSRGVYRFEIYKEIFLWPDTKLWEQEVYVEPSPLSAGARSTLDRLAAQYSPIITLNEDEAYKPIGLTEIFTNPSYSLALTTKGGTSRMSLPAIRDYIRYNGYSKALLEGHWGLGTVSDSLADLPIDSYVPYVYYTYAATAASYIINYHFFYNFDPKTPSTSIGAHNLDREQVSITFSKSTLRPENIYYSQHLIGSEMGLRSDSGSAVNNILKDNSQALQSTWTGYVKMSFPDAVSSNMVYGDTHAIVAIAQGSHAVYPLSGTYSSGVASEPAGITGSTVSAGRFLIPPSLYDGRPGSSAFTAGSRYYMSGLAIENITSGASAPTNLNMLAFSGDWVDIVGLNNEKFPPFIDIMRDADAFISESMKSNKHTFTLQNVPQSITGRAGSIKAYLEDNLN